MIGINLDDDDLFSSSDELMDESDAIPSTYAGDRNKFEEFCSKVTAMSVLFVITSLTYMTKI
jgi:hypothetical protein